MAPILVVVLLLSGCRQYPPVSSKESLELMKLLYSACNKKDEALIQRVETKLAELEKESKVTPEEAESFRKIVAKTKAGDWQTAEDDAYKFAKDQIR